MRKTIQTAILDTAHGLHKAGVMGELTLRELKTLSLPPVKALTPAQIRRIRRTNKTSQAVFAHLLNTSVSTVQKWEIGEKHPSGPSLKLLNLLDRKGIEVLL